MNKKIEFLIKIEEAMLTLGASEKSRITYKVLADLIGWEGSHKNLATSIRTGNMSTMWMPKLGDALSIDKNLLYKLKLLISIDKLEEDIEQIQNTLAFSTSIPNEAKGQLGKELERKSKMLVLCKDRLEGITNLINSNI